MGLIVVAIVVLIGSISRLLFLTVMEVNDFRRNVIVDSSLESLLVDSGMFDSLDEMVKPYVIKFTNIIQ